MPVKVRYFTSDFFNLLLVSSTKQRYFSLSTLSKDATTRLGLELNHQRCDHGRRKNDAPNHSPTLPTISTSHTSNINWNHEFTTKLSPLLTTDSGSTSTIVWKGCGRNNMGNVMQNNLHCDGIKSISKKAINKINANFSECKFTKNYAAIKLIRWVILKNSHGPLKTFPRATCWTPPV